MNNKNKTKWGYVGLTENEVRNEFDNSYYVYLHIHILTNEVLYCGKGVRRRAVSFNRRPYYDEYLKGNIEVDIIARFDNEQEALEYEKREIFWLKYIGHCKYNDSEYHEGKRKGEVETMEEYSYCNEFLNKDIEFENVKLNVMELNMTREYKSNVENFMSNLSEMSYEEVEGMYTLAKQNLKNNDDFNLCNTYHIIIKHLKKYF